MQAEEERVALFEAQLGVFRQMALLGANPAFFREDDGDGLALDKGRFIDGDRGGGAIDNGAARAERAVAKGFLGGFDFFRDGRPALGLAAHQRIQAALFLGELVVLAADFHLLQSAQAAQAHIQHRIGLHLGEAEGGHERAPRLILLAHDADDLIEVEIDDEVAVENFEPPGDGGQTVLGAAGEHDMAVVQPFPQHQFEPHDARRAAGIEHVHIQ